MSNLGGYQLLTTIAKKVHGPKNLVLLLFGGGIAFGVGATKAGGIIKKKIKTEIEKKQRIAATAVIYTVSKEKYSNEGLLFKVGEEFRVLERDGDACLIEKIGDSNNPYFVSAEFLKSISNYNE